MSNIDSTTVVHVAKLARIEIAENEIDKYLGELSNVLKYVDHLQQIDLDNSAEQFMGLSNVFREDEVINTNMREVLLKNCPMSENGLIKVKQVL
jgi:aspartyl-tRNA(Asn)/glutamyl-tRNA(Gln) amidotransferase subunit C